MTTLFTHALTLSTMGIKHYEEKIPTQLESNPRSSHQEADVGPLHYRVAVAIYSQYVASFDSIVQEPRGCRFRWQRTHKLIQKSRIRLNHFHETSWGAVRSAEGTYTSPDRAVGNSREAANTRTPKCRRSDSIVTHNHRFEWISKLSSKIFRSAEACLLLNQRLETHKGCHLIS